MPQSRIPELAVLNTGVGQTPVTTTVTDSSTEIAPANVNRSSIFLLNKGKQDVWVACDATAVLGDGMLLARNGGSMLVDETAHTAGAINGICDTGRTSDVTYQELTR